MAPGETTAAESNLYAGSAGVVLFLVELSKATGDESYLTDARRGADHLAATLPQTIEGEQAGLYTGVAGVGFALERVFQATREAKFRRAALRCVETLHAAARPAGGGVEWSDCTDIISGSAGIGLFLVYAAEEMEDGPSLDLAARAGRRLLEVSESAEGGRRWRMNPMFPRIMPNFSHGTAGVACFLARLHQATGERAFLDAAVDGAKHLIAIADTSDGGCRVYHHEPGGTGLYYLGWCHGPAGTARLFHQLWRTTRDAQWREWRDRAAHSLLESGIPEARSEGFWNNVGVCCGSSGAADFALSMDSCGGGDAYRAFARRLMDDVLQRGTSEARGTEATLKWVQAEHRVRPDLLQAQTGYMQGAAGVGLTLLRLHAAESGHDWTLKLPDSPF